MSGVGEINVAAMAKECLVQLGDIEDACFAPGWDFCRGKENLGEKGIHTISTGSAAKLTSASVV